MPPKSVVSALQPLQPEKFTTAHHIGSPPTGFKNPWPSYNSSGLIGSIRTRFTTPKNFVPVPLDRVGLVKVRKPDFGVQQDGLKATWIGHASFLVETSRSEGLERGARILIDPVWSNRVGPYGMVCGMYNGYCKLLIMNRSDQCDSHHHHVPSKTFRT